MVEPHRSCPPARTNNLIQLNTVLRDQIDQAHLANERLNDELRRTTAELKQVRDEYTHKARDWKEEERVLPAGLDPTVSLSHTRPLLAGLQPLLQQGAQLDVRAVA